MARIVFTLEDYSEIEAELDADVTTFGRNEDNTVVIPSGSVSSHHATITKQGDDYVVQDLGSTNGTRINGELVEVSKLDDGDFISFGDIRGVVNLEIPPVALTEGAYVAPVLSSVAALEALSQPRKTTGPVAAVPAATPQSHAVIPPRPIVDEEPFRPMTLVKVALGLCAAFVIGLHLRHFAENQQVLLIDCVKQVLSSDTTKGKGSAASKNG